MKLTLQTTAPIVEADFKFALWRRLVHDYVRDDDDHVIFFESYKDAKRYADSLEHYYTSGALDVWEVSTDVEYLLESPMVAGTWAARLLSSERYGAEPTLWQRHNEWLTAAFIEKRERRSADILVLQKRRSAR